MFAAAHLRYKPHAYRGNNNANANANENSKKQKCAILRANIRPASALPLLPCDGASPSSPAVARLIASSVLGVALPSRRANPAASAADDEEAAMTAALGVARRRAGSVPVLKYTLAVAWNLRSDHVRALKVTWRRLCDTPRSNCRGIVAIMERVFEKFENKDKTLKEVFYRSAFVDSMADCAEHSRMLRFRRSPLQLARRAHAAPPPTDDDDLAQDITPATAAAERIICAAAESMNSIATLRDHIHFFVSLISQIIQSLQKFPQQIFEHIDRIGCYHLYLRRYGFRAAMWDKLGVCLIDGLVVQDCVRGFPEACRAWTIMVAALIDRLRSAPRHMPSATSSQATTTTPATAAASAAACMYERRAERKAEKIVIAPASSDICRRSSLRRQSRGGGGGAGAQSESTRAAGAARNGVEIGVVECGAAAKKRPLTLSLIAQPSDDVCNSASGSGARGVSFETSAPAAGATNRLKAVLSSENVAQIELNSIRDRARARSLTPSPAGFDASYSGARGTPYATAAPAAAVKCPSGALEPEKILAPQFDVGRGNRVHSASLITTRAQLAAMDGGDRRASAYGRFADVETRKIGAEKMDEFGAALAAENSHLNGRSQSQVNFSAAQLQAHDVADEFLRRRPRAHAVGARDDDLRDMRDSLARLRLNSKPLFY